MKNRRAYRAQMAARQPEAAAADQRKTAGKTKGSARKNKDRKKKAAGKKPRSVLQRFLIGAGIAVAIIIVAVIIASWMGWRSMVDQIEIVPSDEDTVPSEFDVPTESLQHPVPVDKKVMNILLLGIDSQADDVEGRSDAMMVLTVNEQQGRIKLTSLQRDMMVYMPGRDYPDKLNAAHVFGGPALSMRVINETFRLNLEKYVVVNMSGLTQLIDVAGGVEIEISADEARYLNLIREPGRQLLNGRQAVSYARLRKLDDDYMRMQRQRIVLQALLDSFIKADLGEKKSMMDEGLSLIRTNLSANEITSLGLKILPKMNTTIEQMQLPIEGTFNSGMYSEGGMTSWQIRADFNAMIPPLQDFIWGRTFAFDQVREIAGAPNSSLHLAKATPTPRPTLSPTPIPTPEPTPEPTPLPTPEPTETTTAEITQPPPTATDTQPGGTTVSDAPTESSESIAESTPAPTPTTTVAEDPADEDSPPGGDDAGNNSGGAGDTADGAVDDVSGDEPAA